MRIDAAARYRFHKMQGLGNDFLIWESVTQAAWPDCSVAQIQAWTHRRRGVGADQVLCIAPCTDPVADYHYRIFNADGSEAFQCGNGLRCVAALLCRLGASDIAQWVRWRTGDGQISYTACVSEVQVHSVVPAPAALYTGMPIEGFPHVSVDAVYLGNAHAIVWDWGGEQAVCVREQCAAAVRANPRFPHGVNVSFVKVCNPHSVRIETHERGVGWTGACGSAAAAVYAAGIASERLRGPVCAQYASGGLSVDDSPDACPIAGISVIGPADYVFTGYIA